MNNLLLNEYPLIILPKLAVKIGLNNSIFLQQLHYWMQKSTRTISEKKWVYNSYEEWQKQMPFFCIRTLKTIVASLIRKNLISTERLNDDKRDKTNYYTINYDALFEIENGDACTTMGQNLHDATGKICTMQRAKSARCYNTETTTETTTKTTKHSRSKTTRENDFSVEFLEAWNSYPPRAGANSKVEAWKQWQAREKEGIGIHDMLKAVTNYHAEQERLGNIGSQYIMQAQRFFGKSREFEKYINYIEVINNAGNRPKTAAERRAVSDELIDKFTEGVGYGF